MTDATTLVTELSFSGNGSVAGTAVGNGSTAVSSDLQPMRSTIAVIYIILFCTGITGNGVILYTLLRVANNLSVTDIYILNLAISDFLFILNLPVAATDMLMGGSWIFGGVICKTFVSMNYLSLCAGVLIVMSMSVDRFQNVVFAIKMMGVRTVRRAGIIIGAVWVFSLLFMIPASISARSGPVGDSNVARCVLRYQNISDHITKEDVMLTHIIFRFVVTFLVPFVVMAICNITIVHFLRKRRAKKANSRTKSAIDGERTSVHTKDEDRVTRLILLVTTVFLACFFPNLILNAIWIIGPPGLKLFDFSLGDTYHCLLWSSVCLLYLNSALNPFLYAFSGSGFRQRIKQAIFGRRQGLKNRLKEANIPKSPHTAETRMHCHVAKEEECENLPLQSIVTSVQRGKTACQVHSRVCYESKPGENEAKDVAHHDSPDANKEKKSSPSIMLKGGNLISDNEGTSLLENCDDAREPESDIYQYTNRNGLGVISEI